MSATDFITLKGGLTVPAGVVQLGCELENRGFRLRLDGCSALVVEPEEQLTDDDIAAIQNWRYHLVALLHHCPVEI